MFKPKVFRAVLLTPLLLAAWTTSASAYEDYSSGGTPYDAAVPGSGHTGNCAACHGDFRAPGYTAQRDGAAWTGVYSGVAITSLHDIHRRVITSGCNICHNAAGRTPVHLDSSDGYLVGGTQEYTISCLGCHGRSEPNATPSGEVNSASLRQHHQNAGVTECAGCHDDTDPADPNYYTTVGENVLPPYYAVVEPTRLKPSDPCNFDGNETFAGSTGLDNDGDDLYDRLDPDCQLSDINLNPAALNFGQVNVGNSAPLNTDIQNLGAADLIISQISLCAGTSSEFTWVPVALPLTVAANAIHTLGVTYAPVGAGSDTGCLEITSNDPNEGIKQLALSGQTTPTPDINLSLASLNFGNITVGSSATLNTAIQNLGAADLTVSLINLCAGTSTEFSWTLATPFTVAPAASQTLAVTYTPVDAGADTGCLAISSNDPDEATSQLGLDGEVSSAAESSILRFLPAYVHPDRAGTN